MQIEDLYRSLQLNLDRIKSLSLNLEIAKEAMDIAELRFDQGDISSTEIDNIRQRYSSAQQSLNSAKINYITQSARLAKSMGCLDRWVDQHKVN